MKRYLSNEHLEKLIRLHQSATEMTEKTDGVLDALLELKARREIMSNEKIHDRS